MATVPVLDGLIAGVGRADPFDWTGPDFPCSTNFEAIALHIVGQRISIAAGLTIFARVTGAAGGAVTPESLLALAYEELRACSAFLGVSGEADFQTFRCRAKGPHRAAHCRSRMVLPSVMRPSRVMARASAKGSSMTSMSSPSSSSPPPGPVRSAGV